MTKLVGILNITPDSFSDGNQFFEPQKAIARAKQLFKDGASIVDIGAESTRPGATTLSEAEEWRRLEPVLKVLIPLYPGRISVDTYKPGVVYKTFEVGPVIINDVTGLNNPEMVTAVVRHNAECIVSHIHDPGIQKMHETKPTRDVPDVKNALLQKKSELLSLGHDENKIILDPGIGFGKPMELNWELLRFASVVPDSPVMIGYSRKRFLGQNRLGISSNIAAGIIAERSGAEYLRVHDVAGHSVLLD